MVCIAAKVAANLEGDPRPGNSRVERGVPGSTIRFAAAGEALLSRAMTSLSTVTLTRDCNAVQIPAGHTVTLPAGSEVDVTQTLGGTYTVHASGGLFRISGKDADALGLQPETTPAPAAATGDAVNEQMVWETLRSCYDPEIPVNIVDLGLVYDMGIEDLPSGNKKVFVKMTLTAPGCGMGATIAGDAQQKILMLPGVEDASVEIVWDPPWHQSMITAEGRRLLGIE
jgi:probable FeS assembly SUF system protein SufT